MTPEHLGQAFGCCECGDNIESSPPTDGVFCPTRQSMETVAQLKEGHGFGECLDLPWTYR